MLASDRIQISESLILRKATLDDFEFIKEVFFNEMKSIFSEAWKNRIRWDSWFNDMREAIQDNAHIFYVVIFSNKHAGYLWMNEERTSLWITAIVLKKEWQRQKIGSGIMSHLIETCKRNGLKSIELGVQQNNIAAMKFYLSFGFVKFDHISSANTDLLRLNLKDGRNLAYI